jgi:cytochrome b6-f complex iron-sulfur subunit
MADHVISRDRRSLLKMLGAAVAGVLGGYSLHCSGSGGPTTIAVCLESEVPESEPYAKKVAEGHKIFIMRRGGKLVALNAKCSHQACEVFYDSKDEIFVCPCHQGLYDDGGKPIAGPPQRPLRRHTVEIRDGQVIVHI